MKSGKANRTLVSTNLFLAFFLKKMIPNISFRKQFHNVYIMVQNVIFRPSIAIMSCDMKVLQRFSIGWKKLPLIGRSL